MREFLRNEVWTLNESLIITYSDVFLIVIVLILASVSSIIAGIFIRKNRLFNKWELSRKRLLFHILRASFWLIGLGFILAIIGLNIDGFLSYEIIKPTDKSDFSLKPEHIILAVIYIFVTRLVLMGLERVFTSDRHFREKDSGKSKSVFKFISYIIWIIAFLMILNSTGLKLTVLWGAGAAILVGVGFGLQQIIADLVSGIFLLFERNLKEGDVVELNNGIVGKVENIGIRTSKILTRDDYTMIIPNTQFIVKELINWSHNEENTRFHINVGVAYGSDTRLVEKVLLECAEGDKGISKKPKPFVRFENFGESSLDFQLFFWSRRTFRIENLKSSLRFQIDQKFRDNNIQIPFPQRDVHIVK
ncbi:MAG: mechanosensitive ion channel [Bacteroidetes bacterium]|nr:mechanosensitive ion channel [Bacteroidota bacterium]